MTCIYGVVRTMYGPPGHAPFNKMLHQSVLRRHMTEVGPVQCWLLDLRGMTECECMCILEPKPIPNSPLNIENIATVTKENIYRLQSRANCLSTEISQLFQQLKMGLMKQLRPPILSLTIHIRSCLEECNNFCPDLLHIKQSRQHVIVEMARVVKTYETREELNGNSQTTMIEVLASLGEALNSLLDAVQSALVRRLVTMVEDSASELSVKFAVITVFSLTQDSVWVRRLLINENAIGALLAICRITTFSIKSIVETALQAVSTLCVEPEGRVELEKVGGVAALSDILASTVISEPVKREAASILAEITSSDRDSCHQMLCFIEHMEDLLRNLTALCRQTSNPVVFLVAASAIANITFMDTMSSDYLATFNTGHVLIEGYMKGKAPSMCSKHQVIAIIANMSGNETCRQQILKAGGMKLLVELLCLRCPSSPANAVHFTPGDGEAHGSGDTATCEQVHQKSAIALGRLCRDSETSLLAVELNVIPRLVELCRSETERNDSEPVLVACLAALRRLHGNIRAPIFVEKDLRQLVQPRLIESFLTCSSAGSKESFV